MDILSNTKISFLSTTRTHCKYSDIVDFSNKPRPFMSIGLILNGEGTFCATNSADVHVVPGDIIIVPRSATYISYWTGAPDILYISFHIIFENIFDGISEIQKVSGYEYLKKDFEFAHDNFALASQYLKVISIFYNIIAEISPHIKISKTMPLSASVKKAIDYIVFKYKSEIKIEDLAKAVNLSPSRFFSVFKKETGFSPIAYKNNVCIKNAEKMLCSTDLSIEEISEQLGFNSSSYFRRTFKKITGKSPREYKNSLKSGFKL